MPEAMASFLLSSCFPALWLRLEAQEEKSGRSGLVCPLNRGQGWILSTQIDDADTRILPYSTAHIDAV